MVASATGTHTATVWDVEKGKVVFELELEHSNSVCAFSENDGLIFTGSLDGTVKVWDASTGKEISLLKGQTGFVLKCVPSQSGNALLTCSDDKTAKLWDLSTGKVIHTLQHNGFYVSDGCLTSDEKTAITVGRFGLYIWDLKTGE